MMLRLAADAEFRNGEDLFFFFIQADLAFMVSVEKEEKTMITANEFLN